MKRWIALVLTLVSVGATARDMRPRDVDALPQTEPTLVAPYGSDERQVGELRLPAGRGPFPVAIVIHGGCWTKGFATRRNLAPLASALPKDGIATWNIEYRQLGEAGSGWPGTFQDWGAASDYLRVLARTYPLDLKRVIVVGHSAGAHAALWVASRGRLPRTSEIRGADPIKVAGVVAIDGPGDMARFVGFDQEVCGAPVITQLMAGTPAAAPSHFAQGSPYANLPLHTPQYLVTSVLLTPLLAEDWRAAAAAKGDRVVVTPPPAGSDHFNIIAPGEPQWTTTKATIQQAVAATSSARSR